MENATDFAERLAGRDDVLGVDVEGDRTPIRVVVQFAQDAIPEAVFDIAERHEADMVDANCWGDGLRVTWAVPEPLRAGGVHKVRMHGGSSTVVTLAPLTVELSGLGEGTKVEQFAREDEIVLRRW